ncbi:MAG: hypothetical protein NTU59_07040 [Coprothermobacterota bacterium]|nr:hypothetical protein [Coprothermobacterota bacterium]
MATKKEVRMTAKFKSRCSVCGDMVSPGDKIVFYPDDRKAAHEACVGNGEKSDPEAEVPAA